MQEAEGFAKFLAHYVGRERGFVGAQTRLPVDRYERQIYGVQSLRWALGAIALSIRESGSYWVGPMGEMHRDAANGFLAELERKHHQPLDEMSQASEKFIYNVKQLIEELKAVASQLDAVDGEFRDLHRSATLKDTRSLWEELEARRLALRRRQEDLEDSVMKHKRKLDYDTRSASESLFKNGEWKETSPGEVVVPVDWRSDTSARELVIEQLVVQSLQDDDTVTSVSPHLLTAVQLLGITESEVMEHVQKVLTSTKHPKFKQHLVELLQKADLPVRPSVHMANSRLAKAHEKILRGSLKHFYRLNIPLNASSIRTIWTAMPDKNTAGRSNPTSRLSAYDWAGRPKVSKGSKVLLKSLDAGFVLDVTFFGLAMADIPNKVKEIESDFEKQLIEKLIEDIPKDVAEDERRRRAKLLYETFFKNSVQKQLREFQSYLRKSAIGDLALEVGLTVAIGLAVVPGGILVSLVVSAAAFYAAEKAVEHVEAQRLREAIEAANLGSGELIENYEYLWERIQTVGKL